MTKLTLKSRDFIVDWCKNRRRTKVEKMQTCLVSDIQTAILEHWFVSNRYSSAVVAVHHHHHHQHGNNSNSNHSIPVLTNSEIDKLMVKTGLNEKQITNWLSQRMERTAAVGGRRLPSNKILPSSTSSAASLGEAASLVEDASSSSAAASSSSSLFAISGPTPAKKRCVEGMIRSPSKAQRKLNSAAFREGGGGGGASSENEPPMTSSSSGKGDADGGWTSRAGGLRPVARFRPKIRASEATSSGEAAAEAAAAAEAKKRLNEKKIVFRISSNDGFFMESENVDEAWINITAKIQWGKSGYPPKRFLARK